MNRPCLLVGPNHDLCLTAGIVVVSDRCFAGTENDSAGPNLQETLIAHGIPTDSPTIVPDEVPSIRRAINHLVDSNIRLVITTGGTGIGPRDVTPEATSQIICKPLPGLTQLLLSVSLEQTKAAALGRGLVGLTDSAAPALIVNAPGSVRGAKCYLETLLPLLPHLYSQLDARIPPNESYAEHDV